MKTNPLQCPSPFSHAIREERVNPLSKLTRPLFVLIGLTSCVTLTFAMQASALPVFYHFSLAAAMANPATLIITLAIITTASALLILTSENRSLILKQIETAQKVKAPLVDENGNQVSQGTKHFSLAKELEDIEWKESWNQDRRYNQDILFNQIELKDSEKGWVEHISDALKEEGFSKKRIEQVIKSIEIQIFIPPLTTIIPSIASAHNAPISYQTDSEEEKKEKRRATVMTTENGCLVQQRISLKLYKAINGSIEPENPESDVGTLFLKMDMTIPRDSTEKETAFYRWNIA